MLLRKVVVSVVNMVNDETELFPPKNKCTQFNIIIGNCKFVNYFQNCLKSVPPYRHIHSCHLYINQQKMKGIEMKLISFYFNFMVKHVNPWNFNICKIPVKVVLSYLQYYHIL